MNSVNSASVPLQAVLLTMLLEKIDNLTNQVGGMNVTTGELKQSIDSLTARIGDLESAALQAKKESEVKLNDVVNDKREEGALKPPKGAETFLPFEDSETEQGFGDKFNMKQGEWECQTCYLRNRPSSTVCASCGMGKDDKEALPPATSSAPRAAFKPTTFSSPGKAHFSFGNNKSALSFGVASTTTATMAPAPSLAKTVSSTTKPKPAETKSLFGTAKPFSTPAAPLPAETSTTQPKPAGTSLFGSASSFLTPTASSSAKSKASICESKSGESKSLFGSTKPFSFGPPTASTTSSFANANPFGAKSATDGVQPKKLFGGSSLSFSSFASGTSFLNKQTTDSANNSFGAQKSATFGKTEAGKNENEEESENPEEYVPDAHYEPVVPLPDKIEVVTGEEAEQVLFKNRAKLYIFNSETKEVKERGVGDMKVLFHPEKKTYRVVMRREQVHKICANFRITNGMSIADKPGLKNCGILRCVDFSENLQTGALTVFYVRFRDDDVYEEFQKLIGDIAANAQSTFKETTPKKDIPQGIVFSEPPYAFYGEEAEEEEFEEEQLEDLGQDGGEDRSDDAADILFESNCKVTLGAAYKSPLTGDLPLEVHENASLFVLVSDDGIYPVYFDDGTGNEIFLHYVQSDSNYKKDGKKITFTANGVKGGRKAVSCEFKDDAAAEEAFKLFTECCNTTRFVDYVHED